MTGPLEIGAFVRVQGAEVELGAEFETRGLVVDSADWGGTTEDDRELWHVYLYGEECEARTFPADALTVISRAEALA